MQVVRKDAFAEAIGERSTPVREFPLYGPDGTTLVDPGQITSIKLSLRDVTADVIVNSRNAIEAKDQNGGTVTTGLFSFQFAEADTAIVGTGSAEQRVLTVDVHLNGGGRMTLERWFWIRNFKDITT